MKNPLDQDTLPIMLSIIFSLLACGQKTIYTDMYQILSPEQSWKAVDAGGADYAWYNKDLGGIIYVDSNCKKQFEDRPLQDSTLSLLTGIATGEPISEQDIFLDGRKALMTIHSAELDGIDVHIAVVVMSKNFCLYDFLYIAPPHRFNYGLNQFNETIYSFQTKENSVLERKKEQ
jgi:hypothetical protein